MKTIKHIWLLFVFTVLLCSSAGLAKITCDDLTNGISLYDGVYGSFVGHGEEVTESYFIQPMLDNRYKPCLIYTFPNSSEISEELITIVDLQDTLYVHALFSAVIKSFGEDGMNNLDSGTTLGDLYNLMPSIHSFTLLGEESSFIEEASDKEDYLQWSNNDYIVNISSSDLNIEQLNERAFIVAEMLVLDKAKSTPDNEYTNLSYVWFITGDDLDGESVEEEGSPTLEVFE